jgi:hypothetical protein
MFSQTMAWTFQKIIANVHIKVLLHEMCVKYKLQAQKHHTHN